jgi:DNA-binding LacI/PurR family transcriptional regulator
VERLVDRIEHGGDRQRSTTVPVELVVRGSTGAPSSQASEH